MNSDHAPTAHELPPLDKEPIKLANHSCTWGPAIGEYREIVKQRENQLLAALRENRNAESELAIARDLIATMRARIAELEAENRMGRHAIDLRDARIRASISAILEGK